MLLMMDLQWLSTHLSTIPTSDRTPTQLQSSTTPAEFTRSPATPSLPRNPRTEEPWPDLEGEPGGGDKGAEGVRHTERCAAACTADAHQSALPGGSHRSILSPSSRTLVKVPTLYRDRVFTMLVTHMTYFIPTTISDLSVSSLVYE